MGVYDRQDIYLQDYLSSKVISQGKEIRDYYLTYYKANEDLVTIYSKIDFHDKEVLAVQASSDQVYVPYYYGAKNVKSFDMNRLTLYYYFLRKWSILHNQELYPNIYNRKAIALLLSKVKPTSELEQRALDFYLEHIKSGTDFENLFYDIYVQPKGEVPYQASDLTEIVKHDLDFRQINMFEENRIEENNDIVIMSNILDWARNDKKKLTIVRDNLVRLTNDNGIIICSGLVDREEAKVIATNDIFKESFNVEIMPDSKNYVYIKK